MATRKIDRRTVLAAAPAAALLPFLPVDVARAATPTSFAQLVSSVLTHGASAMAIGAAYLKSRPEEQDAAALSIVLQGALALPKVASAEIGRAMFRDAVRRVARRDIRQGDIVEFEGVEFDGVVLSRTEARLCALVYLTRAGV